MARTVFTTITPLPAGISRQTVIETLHDHLEMIDLNPTHEERHRIKPPPEATPEEYHCTWYQITDKISYLPGASGRVSFKACFHDLANGLQTHVYAPMNLDIKEKWTLGGTLPGEPVIPVEIGYGVPIQGLYLREDVEMKCNFFVTKFVKKQLKQALETLVARLIVRSQLVEAVETNRQTRRMTIDPHQSLMSQVYNAPLSPPLSEPSKEPPQWFLEARRDSDIQKTRASYGSQLTSQYGSQHGSQHGSPIASPKYPHPSPHLSQQYSPYLSQEQQQQQQPQQQPQQQQQQQQYHHQQQRQPQQFLSELDSGHFHGPVELP